MAGTCLRLGFRRHFHQPMACVGPIATQVCQLEAHQAMAWKAKNTLIPHLGSMNALPLWSTPSVLSAKASWIWLIPYRRTHKVCSGFKSLIGHHQSSYWHSKSDDNVHANISSMCKRWRAWPMWQGECPWRQQLGGMCFFLCVMPCGSQPSILLLLPLLLSMICKALNSKCSR